MGVKIDKANIETVPIDSIEVHPSNARRGDVDAIKKSIKETGFHGVLVVQKSTGYILAGNHRYLALKELGYDDVTVQYVDVDEELAIKKLLADNKTSDDAIYDEASLLELLQGLDTLDGTGFQDADLDDLLRSLHDGDGGFGESQKSEGSYKPKSDKAFVKPGEVWQVGSHRIACGDSLDPKVYEHLFHDSERATLIVTDPPYGISYQGGPGTKRDEIDNDSLAGSALKEFIRDFLNATVPFTTDRTSFYIWSPSGPQYLHFLQGIYESKWDHRQTIVWNKSSQTLGALGQSYHYKHEFCAHGARDPEVIIYGWKEKGVHDFFADKTHNTVWDIDKPSSSDLHPTQKPIECMLRPMVHASRVGDIVLDPFLGSGTTLIAAEKARRACYGIEVDPVYASICIGRIEEATGVRKEKINAGG